MRAVLLCLVVWFAGSAASSASQPSRTDVRKVEIPVGSSYVLTVLKRRATLHLRVTDCRGATKVDFAFLYFRDLRVDGTSSENADRLKEILPWSGSIHLAAYLPESLLSEGGKLCGEFHGGSMTGLTVPRHEVEIVRP